MCLAEEERPQSWAVGHHHSVTVVHQAVAHGQQRAGRGLLTERGHHRLVRGITGGCLPELLVERQRGEVLTVGAISRCLLALVPTGGTGLVSHCGATMPGCHTLRGCQQPLGRRRGEHGQPEHLQSGERCEELRPCRLGIDGVCSHRRRSCWCRGVAPGRGRQVIRPTGEGIRHGVGGPPDVLDLEVEVGQLVQPPGLARRVRLLRHEVLQRVVVRPDADGERLAPLQVGAPLPEHGDDGQHLLVVRGVPRLGVGHLVRHEGDGLQAAPEVLLQHRAGGEVGRVGVHHVLAVRVRQGEDGGLLQGALQRVEGRLRGVTPREGCPVRRLRQVVQGRGDPAEAGDEPAVVPCKPQERPHLGARRGARPLLDGLHLVGHDAEPVAADAVPEELDLVHEELALALLRVEAGGLQPLEGRLHVAHMIVERPAVDHDVVEEDQHAPVEELPEGVVHHVLEGGRRVGQAHREHGPLEVPVARAEGRLRAVLLRQGDLIEPRAEVDLAEVPGAHEPVEEIIHVRQRIAVAHGEIVEAAVVHAEAEGAVLLLGEDDVGAPGRLGGTQPPGVQVLLELVLQLVELARRHAAQRPRVRLGAGLQLDAVHDGPGRRRLRGVHRGELVGEDGLKLREEFLAQLLHPGGFRLLRVADGFHRG